MEAPLLADEEKLFAGLRRKRCVLVLAIFVHDNAPKKLRHSLQARARLHSLPSLGIFWLRIGVSEGAIGASDLSGARFL